MTAPTSPKSSTSTTKEASSNNLSNDITIEISVGKEYYQMSGTDSYSIETLGTESLK
ncbi:19793_t:CDS:2 [Gigaspora margarita]|uniref:19793_t:CDS:1 n=1 Tax=Gigaspora margarita TaxID=4874 RepID=A0ABN7UT21_GIGMA|nr:19793_t:CDS:2 [Gigaspora margarita]